MCGSMIKFTLKTTDMKTRNDILSIIQSAIKAVESGNQDLIDTLSSRSTDISILLHDERFKTVVSDPDHKLEDSYFSNEEVCELIAAKKCHRPRLRFVIKSEFYGEFFITFEYQQGDGIFTIIHD